MTPSHVSEPAIRPGPGLLTVARRAVALTEMLLTTQATSREVRDLLLGFGEPADIRVTEEDVAELRVAAERLDALFECQDRDSWAHQLNDILASYAGPPRLLAHDGVDWHLHLDTGPEAPWGQWFGASSAFALAILLVDSDGPPVRRCAAEGCTRPFLPTGGGKTRRFCSSRCATRARVAEHRRSRRPASGHGDEGRRPVSP